MITVTTKEKWVEFDFAQVPIKGELNKVWLGLNMALKGQVEISFRFGKIDTRMIVVTPAVPAVPAVEPVLDAEGEIIREGREAIEEIPAVTSTEDYFDFYTSTFYKVLNKTDDEIREYNYAKLHEDALTILTNACLSKATFSL